MISVIQPEGVWVMLRIMGLCVELLVLASFQVPAWVGPREYFIKGWEFGNAGNYSVAAK